MQIDRRQMLFVWERRQMSRKGHRVGFHEQDMLVVFLGDGEAYGGTQWTTQDIWHRASGVCISFTTLRFSIRCVE